MPEFKNDAPALHEGVYAFVSGPSYETQSEAKFLNIIGCDVVGMSTVPEVIVARHCGIQVLTLSLVTNYVVMGDDLGSKAASHEEVLEMSRKRAIFMQDFVSRIVTDLSIVN